MDGGNSWELQKTTQTESFQIIYAVDNLNCWCIGFDWKTSRSLILNTSDGGINWEKQEVDFDVPLISICFINQNTGWAVGDSGIVFYLQKSGGQVWQLQITGITEPLICCRFY